MKKTVSVLLAAVLLLSLCACEARLTENSISGYESAEITVSGLETGDISVTVAQLTELETVSRSATATRANGDRVSVTAVGPLLDTFLAQYGKRQTDFTRVRFRASDGYSIAFSSDVLAEREIILALSDGGKPLSDDDAPVRVVIPGERAMYWVRKLSSIEFESGTDSVACRRIVFLEQAAELLPGEEYDYYGSADMTVSVKSLFERYCGVLGDGTNVTLTAADGLEKSETEANMLLGSIKYTGEDSPRFVSEELPEGMQIYDIVWLSYGATRFASLAHILEQSGTERIFYSDLIRMAECSDAAEYSVTCGDGSCYTVGAAALEDAYIMIKDGGVCLSLGDSEYESVVMLEGIAG